MKRVDRIKGYDDLEKVLHRAYLRAAVGKGRERHANNLPFKHQPIMEINLLTNGGFSLGQAMKKLKELPKLPLDEGINEMLDVIVYAASWIISKEVEKDSGLGNQRNIYSAVVVDKKEDGKIAKEWWTNSSTQKESSSDSL